MDSAMKLRRLISTTLMTAVLALPATLALAAPTQTIDDLKTAYLGETTARQKYAAYSRQADWEGYKEVAALFRATSEAERIHARNHKAALVKLGVTDPLAGSYIETPGTTRENLADAIRGETYERDTMYPAMLQHAMAESQPEAVRSLTFARDAERQHAALYTTARRDLSQKRPGTVFSVCPVCGATFKGAAPLACPTCGTEREKFELIR
jgi:rubrerythrin